MAISEALASHLTSLLAAHRVLLFMKGTRLSPSCGFSAQVVNVLDRYLDAYATVDVVADPALREALREFSEWPTFPQLYVEGRFQGGTEIVHALDAPGELATLLGATPRAPRPPVLHIDREAAEAIAAIGRTVPDAVAHGDQLGLSPRAVFRRPLARRRRGRVVGRAGAPPSPPRDAPRACASRT
ncbi:MAG: glutaredoxin domain-containing protein [Polyangiales bacterium]